MMMNNNQNAERKGCPQAEDTEQSRLASLLTPENIEMALKVGSIGVKVLPKVAAVAGNPVVVSAVSAVVLGAAKAGPSLAPTRMMTAVGMIFGKR